jgi:predicted metalloprotease with PDZ domain
MIRSIQLLLVLVIVTGIPAFAQTTYQVTFPNPNSHYIKVDVTFRDIERDSVDIKMPVWIPGSYMIRDYAKNVEGFVAFSATGLPLRVAKVRKNT